MAGHHGQRARLSAARKAAGYTQEGLAGALSVDRSTVIRWESGERAPLPYVRPRLARLLGCTKDELRTLLDGATTGSTPTDAPTSDEELSDVLTAGTNIGDGALEALRLHLTALRGMDRAMGAAVVRDELRAKLRQVDDMARVVSTDVQRQALLRLLVELHTLAGWTANDQGDSVSAWREHNHARTAAREAGSTAHLAHAQAQQAVILAEAGHIERACAQAADALDAGQGVSGPLRAWLAASYGDVMAYAGDRDAVLGAFDRADHALSVDVDEEEPYAGLDAAHLARWRAQVLVRLAHPDALTAVTAALEVHNPAYRRSEASLRIDLAQGLALVDRRAAVSELTRAESMTAQVASPRQERRASRVRATLSGLA